ncbi:glycosyltransferase family 2 protein [Gordonia sp. NPDC003429]
MDDPSANTTSDDAVAVIMASAGRPDLLADVLDNLNRLDTPHTTVVCVPDVASLPSGGLPEDVHLAYAKGAAAQRNAAMAVVPDASFLFFFDDDAVIREDYIEKAIGHFRRHPEVVALTGRVLLDGADGEEIAEDVAHEEIAASRVEAARTSAHHKVNSLYGCNFAVNRSMAADEKFDERLPLYSWLEDKDLAQRLLRYGRIDQVDDCVIVHRGVKSGGREAHTRYGYSQFMNPYYLYRKGTFTILHVLHAWRPIVKNAVLAQIGRDRLARRRRLKGNMMALADALKGRVTPERIVLIGPD